MANQPGSVVVYKGCSEAEVRGSMLGGYTHSFPFFSNLAEKNLLMVKKFSKYRENGIACLRKGNCVAGRENFPRQNLIETIAEPVLPEKKIERQ